MNVYIKFIYLIYFDKIISEDYTMILFSMLVSKDFDRNNYKESAIKYIENELRNRKANK